MNIPNPLAEASDTKQNRKESSQIRLLVNGNPVLLPQSSAKLTITDLIKYLNYEKHPVAVEVNTELIPKRQHDSVELKVDDEIEVVTLAGGG